MTATFQFLATFTAALFAGAALYINVVEHPARMLLDPKVALLQWAPSYKRATWLQAPLALVSFVCGVMVWLLGGSVQWLLGALLVGSVVPFTFLVIMPTNRLLLADGPDTPSDTTRQRLQRWSQLHAVRSGLSLIGTLVYLRQLVWA